MGNLGETKPMSTLIIEVGGEEYVFSGGGGVEPGVPLPDDTVDTNAIIDGAVQEEDLNESVKDRMTITHDSTTGGLRIGGYAKPGEIPANNAGFDTGADDGSDDI